MRRHALGSAFAVAVTTTAAAQDGPTVPCTITDGDQLDEAATCEILRDEDGALVGVDPE